MELVFVMPGFVLSVLNVPFNFFFFVLLGVTALLFSILTEEEAEIQVQ